jgi:glycosyltransferase involved in cell wall biosynthesis
MQKTNFKFEAIVHDDASTDKTADIVREYAEKYPDIIKPIYETENQYSKKDGSLNKIMAAACTGKYIAMCEGDDYWIDPLKLQKQVDFLEANPEYGMVHGDVLYYVYEKKIFKGRKGLICSKYNSFETDDKEKMFYRIMFGPYSISTLTVLFRKDIYDKIEPDNKKFMMGDTPLWLNISQRAKIKYIDQVFGVYVKHQGSATRSSDRMRFNLSMYEMRVFYCNKYEYTIPNKLKIKYNSAYIRLLIKGEPFDALYDIFHINKLYDSFVFNANLISKHKELFNLLYHTKSLINNFIVKMGIVYKIVENFIWRICK